MLGHNTYAYCGNDPINHVDPDGKLFFAVFVAVSAVALANTIVNAVQEHNLESELEDHYTVDEAIDTINGIFQEEGYTEVKIINHNNSVRIDNSYMVESELIRKKVCIILSRTEGFERSAGNLSAEWLGHNAVFVFYKNSSVASADLDKIADERFLIRFFSAVLNFFGLN